MSARVDEELGEGVLAVFNGKKFKLNDLVDVIVGTGLGVRGNKTEPFKGHFKGVVETERGEEFLVKPLVSGNGRSLHIPRHCVYKINAFGTCVLGRTTRYFSKLKPATQERYVYIYCRAFVSVLVSVLLTVAFVFIFCLAFIYYIRVMKRANVEVHDALEKERKEAKSYKR
jgi:hypothetical protein